MTSISPYTFSALYPDVKSRIYGILIRDKTENILTISLIDRTSKLIVNKLFQYYWDNLRSVFNVKPLYEEGEMESTYETNAPLLFKKLVDILYGNGCSYKILPLEPADIEQRLQDRALVAVWPEIKSQLNQESNLQTAVKIRSYMNGLNENQLNKVQGLYLKNLNLIVIPGEISKLTDSMFLYLNFNGLNILPDSLSNLTRLQSLDLSNNCLKNVPDSLSKLTNLQVLDLSKNNITNVPDSLSGLTCLKIINLKNNPIESIPSSLSSLKTLTIFT